MEGKGALVRWDSFSRELGKAQTLGRVKELANKAKAVEIYCRNAKIGLPAVNTAIMWWLRSARKAGGLLADVERNPGTRSDTRSKALTRYQKTLKDLGLFKQTAHVWQQLAKIPEKKFNLFLTMFKSEEELLSMTALMKLFSVPESEVPPLPHGKFRVIYADPPWEYSNSGLKGSANKHYVTMDLEKICDYAVDEKSVKEMFARDAVLFLWSTNPMLEDALQVCASWGFDYKTNFVWVKDKPTYGKLNFYVRSMHEILLIATKGKFTPKGDLPVSVVTLPKSEHSRKPVEFYAIIETLYDRPGEYLELFARGGRPGWVSHGMEVYDSDRKRLGPIL